MPRRPTEIAKRNVDAAVADHESHGVRRSSNSSKKDSKGTKSGAAFNRVEERDEEVFVEQMGIRKEVEEYLREKFPAIQAIHDKLKREEKKAAKKARKSVRAFDVHKTIKISYPYTLEQVKMVMTAACVEGMQPMVMDDSLMELLTKFKEEYAKVRPNAVGRMDVPKDGKVVVVGDTHGQLNDALWILVSQGLPSEKNLYLFNGDIADRGSNAILIFVIVFMFFFLYPNSILINRGNHEDLFMNQIPKASGGGFFDEVINAYDYQMYELFLAVFKRLPLASVINNEVFVVHGGLARMNNFTTSYIDTLPWNEYTTPSPESTDMKSLCFLDLIWSDPVESMGKFPSKRGAGIQFGVDVTAAFLRQNNLKMMIRSHQCPEDNHGYFVNHQGLCLTVFSASNYCGEVGNWGATITFQGATWPQYTIAEYWAPGFDEIKPELVKVLGEVSSAVPTAGNAGKKLADIEDMCRDKAHSGKSGSDLGLSVGVVQKMVIHLLTSKPQLWMKFTEADPNATTKVPLKKAVQILEKVCGKELKWLAALDFWGVIIGQKSGKAVSLDDASLQLDYDEFLSRFKVELSSEFQSWKFTAVNDAFRYLLSNDMDVEKMIKQIDTNGDGKISKSEFRYVLEQSGADLSKTQMETLMLHVGFQHGDKSQEVDVHQFLARFAAVFKTDAMIAGKQVETDQWAAIALNQISSHVMRVSSAHREHPNSWREAHSDDTGGLFKKIFKAWDKNNDGILSVKEFMDGLKQIPGIDQLRVEGQQLTDDKFKRIVDYIDATNDGTVNYLEFVKALSVDDKMGSVANALCEDITTTLFRNKTALLAACQFFDTDKTMKISMDQFGDALEAVSAHLKPPESPFTYQQIHRLASSAVNEKDVVRYMDFVNSFEILDTFQQSKDHKAKKNEPGVARTLVSDATLKAY